MTTERAAGLLREALLKALPDALSAATELDDSFGYSDEPGSPYVIALADILSQHPALAATPDEPRCDFACPICAKGDVTRATPDEPVAGLDGALKKADRWAPQALDVALLANAPTLRDAYLAYALRHVQAEVAAVLFGVVDDETFEMVARILSTDAALATPDEPTMTEPRTDLREAIDRLPRVAYEAVLGVPASGWAIPEQSVYAALAATGDSEPKKKRDRIDWSNVVVDEGDEAP